MKTRMPVVIVGNINVGGTGKTPLVMWIVEQLKKHGFTPGVVSRGYGGASKQYPIEVNGSSDPIIAGDEPVMLFRRLGIPVVVDPNRVRAVEFLNEKFGCNVAISDDGLQHYQLYLINLFSNQKW